MVYLACKHYEKAIEFFKTTFYAPGIVPSAIQLEAYKKWILASLIYHGTAPSLPTHVPIQLQKRFEKGASKYTGMIHLFENFSFKLMEGMFHTNMDEYTLDGNLGLVKQLLEGMVRCKIQNLTKIYLSLSLQDIEKGLGPIALSFIGNKTIRFVVEDMILKKQIYATITDVQGGMVEFKDDPTKYDILDTAEALNSTILKMNDISKVIEILDKDVGTSANYLAHTKRTTGIDDGIVHGVA
jgi:COP9 signalosome complex subunit 3